MSDSNLSHPQLTSSEIAALHDAARRRAIRLRNEAIADAAGRVGRVLEEAQGRFRRHLRLLISGRREPRCGRPQTV
jgi:hypothetical protein